MYGMFIQNVIDFLIIAFCVFLFVKAINKLTDVTSKLENKRRKKDAKEEKEVVETELSILKEIRDSLKVNSKNNKK